MKHKEKIIYLSICLGLVLVIVFLDQLTKLLIVNNLSLGENIKIILNFFHLEYIQNDGAAWGMFAGNTFVILVIPLIATILFIVLLSKGDFKGKAFYTVGIILMLSGTIGNYIDRFRLGYVVDFLSFRFGSYHFPNFNIADMALVIGVILLAVDILIIDTLKAKKKEGNNVL